MTTGHVKSDAHVSRAGLRFVACVIFAACIAIVFTIPTPVVPRELPVLAIPPSVDRASLARARDRARRAPTDAAARTLEATIELANRRATQLRENRAVELDDEDRIVRRHVADVIARDGVPAIGALRAKAMIRFVDSGILRRPRDVDEASIVGDLHRSLVRYRVVSDDRLVAPALVLRVLYMARWNVIARLPPTSGLGRAELAAYHGWLAYQAPGLSREARVSAVMELARLAPSAEAREAIAAMQFAEDDLHSSAMTYQRLAEDSGNLRLRNLALGLHLLTN